MMLGVPARARRRRGDRAREARRLPARFPRRHDPPVDARAACTSSACSTSSCAAAPGGARARRRCSATTHVTIADFTHLPTRCRFIAFMPQWDFLDFLARAARALPGVSPAHAGRGDRGCIEEGGRVVGVRAQQRRRAARGARRPGRRRRRPPLDRAPRRPGSRVATSARRWTCCGFASPGGRRPRATALGRFERGRIFVMLDRGELLAVRLVIPKGAPRGARARARGLPRRTSPQLRRRCVARRASHEIGSWDDVKLLTVQVDRLERWWRPGLLCIGDAAHAMSPVGGVGINLAIQDAVAAANLLAASAARTGALTPKTCAACRHAASGRRGRRSGCSSPFNGA